MEDRRNMSKDHELSDFRMARGLDPVVREILIGAAAQGLPKLPDVEPAMSRAYFEQVCEQLNAMQSISGETEDLRFQGIGGDVSARLYRQADQAKNTGVILFFHGGGWVLGSVETHDPLCRQLARATGWPVLSVNYRLAPENPFPAALEDAQAALSWLRASATELCIDPAKIVVAGDSAGGNIAAALTLADTSSKAEPLFGQVLIYPVIADHFDTPSMHRFAKGFGLERADMEWFVAQYQGGATASQDPLHSPYYAATLKELPQAVVITAGFDPLHDEGAEYAERLRTAGNKVDFRDYGTLNHGFLTLVGIVPAAKEAQDDIMELVKALCWRPADAVNDVTHAHQIFK